MKTNRMLQQKEASFLETDGDIVADLEAKIDELQKKLLNISRQRPVEWDSDSVKEDTPLQQRLHGA